jgi:hypothetical protein
MPEDFTLAAAHDALVMVSLLTTTITQIERYQPRWVEF